MNKAKLLPTLGAGFSLMRRHPGSSLAWGVVYFLLALIPSIAALWLVGSDWRSLLDFYRDLHSHAESAEAPEVLGAIGGLQGLQLFGSLAAASVVVTAIQRAVLFPDQNQFFYIRAGLAELRTGLIIVVLCVMMIVLSTISVLFGGVIVSAVVITFRNSQVAEALAGVLTFVLALSGIVVAVGYPLARLGLSIPMSLADGRLRLFEAWRISRGYGWRLFGVGVVMTVLIFAALVLLLVILAILAFVVMGGLDLAHIRAFEGTGNRIEDISGFAASAGIFFAILTLVSIPVMIAPWAKAYQIIAGEARPETAFQ